jgi:hypothetical protein
VRDALVEDDDDGGTESDEATPAADPTDEGDAPKRRRRRRGGRRHRRKKGVAASAGVSTNGSGGGSVQDEPGDAEPDDAVMTSGARHTHAAQRVPPATPPAPVVRTGSTDRHLIHDDEPVHHEPPRRPRTYRDLDAIPEDFD